MRQFVVAVQMSDFQRYLYKQTEERLSPSSTAFQTPVWNHPYLTVMKESNERTNLIDISKALGPQLKKSVEVAEVCMVSTDQIEDILLRSNEQTGSSWGFENSSDSDSDDDGEGPGPLLELED